MHFGAKLCCPSYCEKQEWKQSGTKKPDFQDDYCFPWRQETLQGLIWSASKGLLSLSHESRKIIIKNKKTKENTHSHRNKQKNKGGIEPSCVSDGNCVGASTAGTPLGLTLEYCSKPPLQVDFLHTVNVAQSHFPKDASEECSGQVQDRRTLNVSRLTSAAPHLSVQQWAS